MLPVTELGSAHRPMELVKESAFYHRAGTTLRSTTRLQHPLPHLPNEGLLRSGPTRVDEFAEPDSSWSQGTQSRPVLLARSAVRLISGTRPSLTFRPSCQPLILPSWSLRTHAARVRAHRV